MAIQTHSQRLTKTAFELRKLVLRFEFGVSRTLLLLAIVLVPYSNIEWPDGGWIGSGTLFLGGIILAFVLTRSSWRHLRAKFVSVADRIKLRHVLLAGVFCQFAVAIITDPILVSDPRTYLALAERLAGGLEYVDESGHRAFWPPGLPLYLTPFVFVFGAGVVAVAAANVTLYLIGAFAAWDLGRRIFDDRVAVLAALLFTIWPSRLLTAAVASKENLTIATVLMASSLCVAAFGATGRKAWLAALGAGSAFGIGALAQPGLLLFALCTPIIYRGGMAIGARRGLVRCLVVCASAAICLSPWHIRNCIVFDGQFCGLTTSGGSVFYRANNPKATGLFIPEGVEPITHLPELEQNRIGFSLGKQWIRENPVDFVKLAARKIMHLLSDDANGAYIAVLRGGGLDHERALRESSVERVWSYKVSSSLSTAFWVIVVAWAVIALRKSNVSACNLESERLLPLVYPLLYSAAVFSVFESGTRQHMAAEGPLLVLAASFLGASPRRPPTDAAPCKMSS